MPRVDAASRKCLRSETVRALGYLLVATAAGSARAEGKKKKKYISWANVLRARWLLHE